MEQHHIVHDTSRTQSRANAPSAAPATATNDPVSASPAFVVAAGAAEPLVEAVPCIAVEEECAPLNRVAAAVVAGVVPLPEAPVPVALSVVVEKTVLVSLVVAFDVVGSAVGSTEVLFAVVAVANAEEGVKQER